MRRLDKEADGHRRPGPGPIPRVARRLPVHQGTRGTGGLPSTAKLVPMTIIRPSIIESALAEPRPGWIRGFRMAELIIVPTPGACSGSSPALPKG